MAIAPENRDKAAQTKDNLIRAAEKLFAEQGIAGASLRAITQEAEANLASVNYHFGSKDDLVKAVLARRLEPLNRERLALLDRYSKEGGGTPGLERIVRAFISPVLTMIQRERGGHAFARFVGRAFSEPDPQIRGLLLEQFKEVIGRFTKAMIEALPHIPSEEIYWRFHFMVGAMVHTAGLGFLVRDISGGLCNPLDVDGVTDRLVCFITGGLRAPAFDPEWTR
jgi:AcrR family transcriptional regulator